MSARAHKASGAVCMRLAREQFLPLLKMFPDDEECIAQAALSSYEVVRSQAGRWIMLLLDIIRIFMTYFLSRRSGSVYSCGQKSALSSHSRASSSSRKSMASSKDASSAAPPTESTDRGPDDDSVDSEEAIDSMVGTGMMQKIESLKLRRRSDRINVILTAAARGDLEGLRKAIRVIVHALQKINAFLS